MKNPDQYSSLFWLILGAVIAGMSLHYGLGSLKDPGLGFITFVVGVVLSILSLAVFISSLKDHEERQSLRELWAGLEVEKVIYVVLLLVIYTLVLRSVGYLIATFILLCFLFRLKKPYRLRSILFMAFVTTFSSYVVFEIWLQAQLPKGILEGVF
jgi:putative tricarboxylic transport membrane protein